MVAANGQPEMTGWTRDTAVEGLLARLGVVWVYRRNVQTVLIDRTLSLSNQARLGLSLDKDVVEEYALAMLEGDAFPALVAYPRGDGTYILAGGNHRLHAADEAGITHLDLYELNVKDQAMRRLITTSLNRLVGVRPGRADTVEQAIMWVDNYRKTAREAARLYGIPESTLTTEMRVRSARKRIQLAGVMADKLGKTAIRTISTIPNDIVLREAARLQADASLTEPDLRRMVQEVRNQRTEAGQLEVVRQWAGRDEVKFRKKQLYQGRGALSPSARIRAEVFRGLKTTMGVLEGHVSRGQAGLSDDTDYANALVLARALLARLEELGETLR